MKNIMITLVILLLPAASVFALEDFKNKLFSNINAVQINEEFKGSEQNRADGYYGETKMDFKTVRKAIEEIVNKNNHYRQTLAWQTENNSEYAMFQLGRKRVAVFYNEGRVILSLPPCCEPIELPF